MSWVGLKETLLCLCSRYGHHVIFFYSLPITVKQDQDARVTEIHWRLVKKLFTWWEVVDLPFGQMTVFILRIMLQWKNMGYWPYLDLWLPPKSPDPNGLRRLMETEEEQQPSIWNRNDKNTNGGLRPLYITILLISIGFCKWVLAAATGFFLPPISLTYMLFKFSLSKHLRGICNLYF